MKLYLTFWIVLFHLSTTAQITWTGAGEVATDTCSNMHPRISLDAAGNPLVVWGRMNDQTAFFSRWTGSAFSAPVILNPPWMPVATASWMGPDIASHGDTVYVVVKRIPESADTNRIFLFTSFDGGASFHNAVELGFIADSISRFPAVTTDASGNPLVAFMKFNASFLDSRWVVTRSSDYGTTFSPDTKASGWGGSAEVCDCCPGEIISNGNTCVMLYRDNNANLRDSWAGISADNAISFTNGCAVDDNNWVIAACPASG
ncbi:MAG: exo-alpha-sialidase, partial [Bacteroidia bacterium]|nr:exo-alpha-sialidase [Bacteroidia bacterium]